LVAVVLLVVQTQTAQMVETQLLVLLLELTQEAEVVLVRTPTLETTGEREAEVEMPTTTQPKLLLVEKVI
jgi:hypothetical protein